MDGFVSSSANVEGGKRVAVPAAAADSLVSAAGARISERAAEMVAARPPRSRSVKDFMRAVGGHSIKRRWSQILSDLDTAMADPNIKVR